MEARKLDDADLLELVGDLMGVLELEEFRSAVLAALVRFVPARYSSLTEISQAGLHYAAVEPAIEAALIERFDALGHENPLYQYYLRTGDGRAYRFSDVVTRAELEATGVYQEFYAPLGVQHQIAFTLPAQTGRTLAFVLSRGEDDFTDAERRFLDRARPFLAQAYRNALAARKPSLAAALRGAGLSARQAEVIALVAQGCSTRDAATELGLSFRTVQKHLEHAFRALGVTSRSAAAARAWELAAG